MGKCSLKDAPPEVSWLAGWGPTLVASLGFTESGCGSGSQGPRLRAHSESHRDIYYPRSWLSARGCGGHSAFAVGRHQEPSQVCKWKPRLTGTALLSFSRSVVSDSLQPHGLQHSRLPCPSLSPRVCSGSCPLSWWCCLTISSSAALFFCLHSFPASESFPLSSLQQLAEVLELQQYSLQWTLAVDFLGAY